MVTGPNTVVDAIAAGKKAAIMIERYLRDEPLEQDGEVRRPSVYVPPVQAESAGSFEAPRVDLPRLGARERAKNFLEVEKTLSKEDAVREARRCLRCDLEFVRKEPEEKPVRALEEAQP